MSNPFPISPDDLVKVLEKMGYRYIKTVDDVVYLVSEKADTIAIPIKKAIGEEKFEEICEILKVPIVFFLGFF